MKVTNNHTVPLAVAGVDIRPGATAEVSEVEFARWKNGHAAKIWLKEGFISEGEVKKAKEPKEPAGGSTDEEKEAERQQLLAEARELGLNPNVNTGIEKLRAAIAEKKG